MTTQSLHRQLRPAVCEADSLLVVSAKVPRPTSCMMQENARIGPYISASPALRLQMLFGR
jgi:hypothetical protein